MERERRAQRHMQRAMELMEEQSFGARSQIQEESFGSFWRDHVLRVPRDHKDDLQKIIDELKVKYKELEKQYQVKTEDFEEQVEKVREANKKVQDCTTGMTALISEVDDLKKQLTKEKEKPSPYSSQYQELNEMMKKEREERDVLNQEIARLKKLVPKDQLVGNEEDTAKIQRLAEAHRRIQDHAGMHN